MYRFNLIAGFWILHFILVQSSLSFSQKRVGAPLPHTHAHNDYRHLNPLWDALGQGFTEIEVDIFPVDGQIYVAHDPVEDWTQTPLLDSLYLFPLIRHIEKNGTVYPEDSATLWLMIDIKKSGDEAFDILQQRLAAYPHIFQHKENGKWAWAPVRVFLSGDRPFEKVLADSACWMGLDGRPSDLGKGYHADYMPVISQHYRRVMQWRGSGPISVEDQQTLKKLSETAHKEGKKVRLWATPEQETLWETLLTAGIDLLNTDELMRLAAFLRKQ